MTYGPGIHTMPEHEYHADPVDGGSLSRSGAWTIYSKNPATFRFAEPEHQSYFNLGTAAHAKVLGVGVETVVVDAADWRTKAAQQKREEAYAEGKTPLLAADAEKVEQMAQALRQHPIAARLFDGDHGLPEQTVIFEDEETGVMRRCRLDWLPGAGAGRLIIPDYKTAASAQNDAFANACKTTGYHMQDAWYCDAVKAVGLDDDPAFVFVVQEKTKPYLVNVIELDADAKHLARNQARQAIATYADCVRTDTWPGYPSEVQLVGLPSWYLRQHEMEMSYVQ